MPLARIPVFNGSASLRNAAGQLIEDVNKSVRRKQKVDDAYWEDLFREVSALYRLDQTGSIDGKAPLGPMPGNENDINPLCALQGFQGLCHFLRSSISLHPARHQ